MKKVKHGGGSVVLWAVLLLFELKVVHFVFAELILQKHQLLLWLYELRSERSNDQGSHVETLRLHRTAVG